MKKAKIKKLYTKGNKGGLLILGFVLACPKSGKDIHEHKNKVCLTIETLHAEAKRLRYTIVNEDDPLCEIV